MEDAAFTGHRMVNFYSQITLLVIAYFRPEQCQYFISRLRVDIAHFTGQTLMYVVCIYILYLFNSIQNNIHDCLTK